MTIEASYDFRRDVHAFDVLTGVRRLRKVLQVSPEFVAMGLEKAVEHCMLRLEEWYPGIDTKENRSTVRNAFSAH